jgi:hypothetical protein
MNDVKPWHIAVIALGLLVGLGSVVYQCRKQAIPFADHIMLVDVTTGELIKAPLPKNKSVFFPAKNPESKQPTLYPAVEENGAWKVEGRYLPYVADLKDPASTAINPKSGAIAVKGSPSTKDVFK